MPLTALLSLRLVMMMLTAAIVLILGSAVDARYSRVKPDKCFFDKDPGDCRAPTTRYYYDSGEGRCRTFEYGGCNGNGNNFETLAECQRNCSNVCGLQKLVGKCRAGQRRPTPITRFYFDSSLASCAPFIYEGCGDVSANNFPTMEACKRVCPNPNPVCLQKSDVGTATNSNYVVRWHFNSVTWDCRPFVYSGEGGNSNNFRNSEECKNNCPLADLCRYPADPGPCDGALIRWRYDEIYEECEVFLYGGCLGNDNNFRSEEACMQRCPKLDVCKQPLAGNSPGSGIKRYYYDANSKSCLSFEYSGFGGNENNFMSEKECKLYCPQKSPCAYPLEKGNSNMRLPRWYYDLSDESCKYFEYSGNGGNPNRFDSMEDCQEKCGNVPVCTLPLAGRRSGSGIERYYYDTKTERCKFFEYSGVGGNMNNFMTVEECRLNCPVKSPCAYPVEKGSGNKSYGRWYYNLRSRMCSYFVYSGEGGNPNRFSSMRECQNECLECDKDADRGPCLGFQLMYFYNSSSRICQDFVFGGCEGNKNRFASMQECQDRCL